MVKPIENKFNRMVKNSNPQELEDKFVNHAAEAMDDILNGNNEAGNEKLNITIKFFQNHKHIHPQVFSRASKRINKHLLEIMYKGLEDTVISYQKLLHLMKIVMVIDLIFYNFITDALVIYQKNSNELEYLKWLWIA